MSDTDFRKYERAVREGDIDAIPQLITAALRTNTPIHQHLPVIYDNLNQNVIRTLEGSELMDLRMYRVHSVIEAAAILERSGRVLPSLEIIALNHEITGFAGRENSDILTKEGLIALDETYFVRATPLFRLARGQRTQGTDEGLTTVMRTYTALASTQNTKEPHTRSISPIHSFAETYNLTPLFSPTQSMLVEVDFLYDERNDTPIRQLTRERVMFIRRITERVECQSDPLTLTPDNTLTFGGATMIPTVSPRTEYLLGNPNVFEFPQ